MVVPGDYRTGTIGRDFPGQAHSFVETDGTSGSVLLEKQRCAAVFRYGTLPAMMEGAELSLEAVKITPCSEGDPSGQTIAENLIILPVEVRTAPVPVAKRSEPEVRDTVPDAAGLFAEELMREYPV